MSQSIETVAPLLEMRNISKTFPGVKALDRVNFTLFAGEVLALVGENGAGKSTLMKVLSGAYSADAGGEILIDGQTVHIDSPKAAERAGVGIIYQELNLVPDLDVIANITLGAEPTRGAFLNRAEATRVAQAILNEMGIKLPLGVPVRHLSVAQQQVVEIAKALNRKARIIVMDEPTAALTDQEIEHLFEMIHKLKKGGAGIVYISHRLEELARIVDRVTVLRDGQTVATRPFKEMPQDEMVSLMVGRTLEKRYPDITPIDTSAPEVLNVQALRSKVIKDVSFTVHAGEIVGVCGMVGSGRTEIVRAIAGADKRQGGSIAVDGKVVRINSPRDGIKCGIALITEDRKNQGLILGMTVRENTTLAHLKRFANRFGFVSTRAELAETVSYIKKLRIRTPSAEQKVANLSGGNQQKVVLSKWLVGGARVFLFDEPTRGIDVGSKAEIYDLMLTLAKQGAAIVIVSSDLPEVLGLSHRVLVIRDGSVAAEVPRAQATPDHIISIATGASN